MGTTSVGHVVLGSPISSAYDEFGGGRSSFSAEPGNERGHAQLLDVSQTANRIGVERRGVVPHIDNPAQCVVPVSKPNIVSCFNWPHGERRHIHHLDRGSPGRFEHSPRGKWRFTQERGRSAFNIMGRSITS